MPSCRFCSTPLSSVVIDLGESPVANSFLTREELDLPEEIYPLKVFVCNNCFLVQLEEIKKAQDIFKEDYAYFSSYSTTWLQHAKDYCEMMVKRFHLNEHHHVIEVGSNDGYLLQYFKAQNIPVLGIEPSSNVAAFAQAKGIETRTEYFGTDLAKRLKEQGITADLLIGNNVLAHVPDIMDFVSGLKRLLAPSGIVTMEFPHLYQLIRQCQFDTIYHEHFSYFSFHTVKRIFEAQGIEIFNVEEIPTHGGSLRIYGQHRENQGLKKENAVDELLEKEEQAGITQLHYYEGLNARVKKVKNDLLTFLREQKLQRKKVAAYGAAAKGNTLLNYCGVKSDLVSLVADRSSFKQGKFLPGSHIPVVAESELQQFKPDYILILPWNIKEEIKDQLKYAREWGAKFVVAIPELSIS